MNKPILTVSSLKRYRRCPREYFLRVERGLSPRARAGALRFGALTHNGLESWWQARDLDAALSVVQGSEEEVDPYDQARVEVMLSGYHVRWFGQTLQTLAVEAEFATGLRNPNTGYPSKTWRIAGKIDAIARDELGQDWIVEHKTTSEDMSLGSEYWARLAMDSQVSTYFVGARALGYNPVGCIYDVLGKPGIRPKKATPEESRKYKKMALCTPTSGRRTRPTRSSERAYSKPSPKTRIDISLAARLFGWKLRSSTPRTTHGS